MMRQKNRCPFFALICVFVFVGTGAWQGRAEAGEASSKQAIRKRASGKDKGPECDFAGWKQAVLKGSPEGAKKAVTALSHASSECVTPFLKTLNKASMGPKEYDDLRRVFKRASIPMPVYSGWFKVPKLRKGEVPDHRKVDISKSLSNMKEPRNEDLKAVYRQALFLCGVVQGLGGMENTSVAEPLVRFSFRRAGFAFRHQVSRTLERLRAYAVPGLLELADIHVRDWKTDRVRYLLQKYAGYMLTVLREGDPHSALSWADVSLKLELFQTYGRHRVADAARAVVDYTDAEDPEIRKAARQALMKYFKGPKPRAVRRHLKLPGGEETKDRRLVYMNFRQRASHEVRVELERLTSGAFKKRVGGVVLAKALFSEQDRRRRERDKRWMNRAIDKWESGDEKGAIKLMENLLACEPTTPLATQLGGFFHRYAVSLFLKGDLERALRYVTLAYVLYEKKDKTRQSLSESAYLRGLLSKAHGARREISLAAHEEALGWWPQNEMARRATVALSGNTLEPAHAYVLAITAGGVAVLFLWFLGWMISRKREG